MASDIVRFILFFCLLPCLAVAQSGGRINVGKFLTAGENSSPWLSPSQHFAFGFHQLDGKDLYLPAIWYNKIPDKTIVWYAKEDNGDINPVPAKSRLELLDSGIVIRDPQGTETGASIYVGQGVYYGFMNDTGNFVIKNSDDATLWKSFDYPTDTLLPSQILPKGGIKLSSRRSQTDLSRGKFQFRIKDDGDAVLNAINLPTGFLYDEYYSSDTKNNASTAGEQVVFDELGSLYVLRANGENVVLTTESLVPFPSTENNYHRVTLNFDGVLTQYYHPKNSDGTGNWSIINSKPDNICEAAIGGTLGAGTASCGFNSICSLSTEQRAICECPPRFSLIDSKDKYGGCKPDFPTQLCDSSENYELQELNVDWVSPGYESYIPYSIQQCMDACLEDCFCFAIVHSGQSCFKRRPPLSNGRYSTNAKSFIKVTKNLSVIKPPPLVPPIAKKNQNPELVVLVLLGGSVFLNFTLVGVGAFCFLVFCNKKLAITPHVERAVETNLRFFSFRELMEATNGFEEELGRGSYGIVYKGQTEMGSSVPIAVKKLDRIAAESEKEFRTEVNVIGKTHHKNLVRLLGFCDERQERLLVYEFLSNGTLASFLYGDTKLSWNQRIQIAIGTARGLLYLHEECSTQTIHCDIKPQNILLDDCYDARIADFGLAKLLSLDQSHTYTGIRGTKGYVAPEWFRNCPITAKVDVYGFGVLLLEIICCRRCTDEKLSDERAILTDWAYDCYGEGALNVLIENDKEALNDIKRVESLVMVAIWCIQEDPSLRPTMKKVTLMLEGNIEVPIPPCPFPFSMTG